MKFKRTLFGAIVAENGDAFHPNGKNSIYISRAKKKYFISIEYFGANAEGVQIDCRSVWLDENHVHNLEDTEIANEILYEVVEYFKFRKFIVDAIFE